MSGKLTKIDPKEAQAKKQQVSAPARKSTVVYDPAVHKPDTKMFHSSERLLKDEYTSTTDIVRMSWEGDAQPCTFRITPTVDPDDGTKFLSSRRSLSPDGFNPWFFSAATAAGVGLKKTRTTFFLGAPWERRDVSTHPYTVLFNEFHGVCGMEDPEAKLGKRNVFSHRWPNMQAGAKGHREHRAFERVKELTYARALVYCNKKFVNVKENGVPRGAGAKDRRQLVQMSPADAGALKRALNIKASPPPENPKRLTDHYKYKDITSLKLGRFVTFYHPDQDLPYYEVPANEHIEADDGDSGDGFKSRKLMIHEQYTYKDKSQHKITLERDITKYQDRILEQYVWWEDLFYFPCDEEACELLAMAFREMPDVIRFCWRENPEFLTPTVKGILSAKTQGPGAEVPADDEEPKGEIRDAGDDDDDDEEETRPSSSRKQSGAIPDEETPDEEEDENDGESGAEEEEDENDSPAAEEDEDEEGESEEGEGDSEDGEAEEDEEELNDIEVPPEEDEDDAPPLPKASAKSNPKANAQPAPKGKVLRPKPKAASPDADLEDDVEDAIEQADKPKPKPKKKK